MLRKCAGVLIAMVLTVCAAVGQSTFGSIVGMVHDKTQAVVPDATVKLRSLEDKKALAQEHAKELLLLMDTDKNGKISKLEWMKFMEAEFDRLDKDKTGEIDPKELRQSKVQVSQKAFAQAGK